MPPNVNSYGTVAVALVLREPPVIHMNLHPIFVHFPIALLTIYTLLETASIIKRVRERAYIFYVKATFLLGGVFGAVPAYLTGDAQEGSAPVHTEFYRAMTVHSRWALATVLFFGALAAIHAAAWLCREWTGMPERLRKVLDLHRYATETALTPVLALFGLCIVTVTGALGGALAYGSDIDPTVSFIYKLLVK